MGAGAEEWVQMGALVPLQTDPCPSPPRSVHIWPQAADPGKRRISPGSTANVIGGVSVSRLGAAAGRIRLPLVVFAVRFYIWVSTALFFSLPAKTTSKASDLHHMFPTLRSNPVP